MVQWRSMADPLYQPFDMPQHSMVEQVRWFNWRNNDPSRRLYTVENEERQVIGSLTLREIDGRHSARLGITLGADYVSQGYGTDALRVFLDYYFDKMGFDRLVLDVAGTNLRASAATWRWLSPDRPALSPRRPQKLPSDRSRAALPAPAAPFSRRGGRSGSPVLRHGHNPRRVAGRLELTSY